MISSSNLTMEFGDREVYHRQSNGTRFDSDSILLYFFSASWTRNGIGTDGNEILSDIDRSFIAGEKMYPKTGAAVADAESLKARDLRAESRPSIPRRAPPTHYPPPP
jgi:hypothetical protein